MASNWSAASLKPGQNAYADWSFGAADPYTGFRGSGDWYLSVLQLNITIRELFDIFVTPLQAARSLDEPPLVVPLEFLQSPIKLPPYVSALVQEEFFEIFNDSSAYDAVPQVILGPPVPEEALPTRVSREKLVPMDAAPKTSTVVTGIIDDGIAFANQQFRTTDGKTRIEYMWLQDGVAPATSSVAYGREFTKSEINGRLAACTSSAKVLNEEKFYRETGLVDFSRSLRSTAAQRVAHGTHVADLACGFEPAKAPANRPMICVQLPSAITANTSGLGLDPHLLHAVHYILDRADDVAAKLKTAPLPVVINFSYGIFAGPHDGTHPIEADIDRIIETREGAAQKVRAVVPAGNGHLARYHAEVTFDTVGEEKDLYWRVLPDDATSSFVEIWMPKTQLQLQRLEVQVTPPNGDPSPWLSEIDRAGLVWKPNGVDVLCKLSYEFVTDPTLKGRFVIAILPTAFHNHPTDLAPSGVWTIKLRNKALSKTEVVNAWVQRDDTPLGYPTRGRQSYFDHENYQRYDQQGKVVLIDGPDCLVKRAGTISAFATGTKTIVIGGMMENELTMSDYSAAGPAAPPADAHRGGPDATVGSDSSAVHTGTLAAGTRDGSVVSISGTSVAAPRIARAIADDLAAGNNGDRTTVGEWALDYETNRRPPNAPAKPDAKRGGKGRVPTPSRRRLKSRF